MELDGVEELLNEEEGAPRVSTFGPRFRGRDHQRVDAGAGRRGSPPASAPSAADSVVDETSTAD